MKRLSIKLRINIYYTAILVIMAGILMSGMLAITDRGGAGKRGQERRE